MTDARAWAALDDRWLVHALAGLIDGTGHWDAGALGSIERTGAYLRGEWDPAEPGEGPGTAGEGSWARFIGRIGAVALRAASAPTRDERRQRQLALLEMWAETPFADPSARLRTGIVVTESAAVRDGRGAAVVVGWRRDRRRRFVDLRTGDADPPSLGEIEEVAEVPRGWGSAEQLRRLVTLVRERGPAPWDREAVDLLRDGTGLGRATASLVLAGMVSLSHRPTLDADERATLRLKTAEAEDAHSELGRVGAADRLELLADVLPDDPADLWEPGGMRTVAERIAQAWRARYGRRTVVPERTLSAVVERGPFPLTAGRFCAAFTDPAGESTLRADLDTWLRRTDYGCSAADERWDIVRFRELLSGAVPGLPWAYAELPAGDPVRDGVPRFVALLKERLNHPGLLLDAGYFRHTGDEPITELREVFGGRPYAGPERLDVATVDDGLTVGAEGMIDRRGYRDSTRLYFRPALYGDDERSKRLSAASAPGVGRRELETVEWLRGPVCARIVDRIASAALPAGRYETDPAASAPGVVSSVAGKLGLDQDPAVLYLQLLVLPRPADRGVRTWNGWTAARHQEAAAALVGRGLAVEDKRARAGRQLFLPGGWAPAPKKPHQPMEVWKADLHGLRLGYDGRVEDPLPLPTRTLPELFAEGWARVEAGEGPR
ncbi:hypothetical protein ACFZCY_05040 [Streptomyces sp. NPDC007983]|uniref:hypothetical protein n=1 Tax=Streptomyces sp. NPDC007983 TaxID=3364800 RepID=UPI0036EB25C6